jgi:DNA repair protein RecN (Recombination protein N)
MTNCPREGTDSPGPMMGDSQPVLCELSVQNLALIEDIHVDLEDGYCAWTGETGAGKSLLLTALGLVLGDKASADLIRSGKSEARAAAVFEITESGLRGEVEAVLGCTLDDEQLVITRRLSSHGRGSAQVNGLPVAITTLQKLAKLLVDIHGQLEGRALLDPDRQRDLLDAYGNLDGVVRAYRQARLAHETMRRKRQALLDSAATRRRERALLEFERSELATADPRPGEYDELARIARRKKCAEQIRTAAASGYSALYEADHSAQELLTRVARSLEPLTRAAPELVEATRLLERLAEETREVAFALRDLGQGRDQPPTRLDDLEARMALYRTLAARFHCTPDELAARREAIDAKLSELDENDADLLALDEPLTRAWATVKQAAGKLTIARRELAGDFARVILKRLKPLGLGGSRFVVEIETQALADDPSVSAPPESGVDRLEFLFSANPGEEPRPLRKIASGGELSRLTLAAKAVLAAVDRVPTLIFDEIDTGVGGRLGSALGKALGELARHHQVICVTHLPQIASYAHHQWVIRKRIQRGRSRTTITPLGEADRVKELAAMLRGDSAAEGTRQEAMAMLTEARARR